MCSTLQSLTSLSDEIHDGPHIHASYPKICIMTTAKQGLLYMCDYHRRPAWPKSTKKTNKKRAYLPYPNPTRPVSLLRGRGTSITEIIISNLIYPRPGNMSFPNDTSKLRGKFAAQSALARFQLPRESHLLSPGRAGFMSF